MAYTVMVCIAMAYIVMAYVGMAYVGMSYVVMAYTTRANVAAKREARHVCANTRAWRAWTP